jgi:1-acyl-sn-glycerol-3-phosphate acyltransferase
MVSFFDARALYAHRVPVRGPALLAANHSSFLDPILVGSCLARRCSYLARDSLFRNRLMGAWLRALGAVPVSRESLAPKRAVKVCLEILAKNRLLIMFPEGTRSEDGSLGTFRRGISLIVKRSGAPVIPVRIVGSYEAWPRQRFLPREYPVRILFGKPLRFDEKGESADVFLGRLRTSLEELGCQAADSSSDPRGPRENLAVRSERFALRDFAGSAERGAFPDREASTIRAEKFYWRRPRSSTA